MNANIRIAEKALEELRKRLLDTSSRNKLIKFKVSDKAGLRVIDELPDQLAQELLSDQKLSFRPVPNPTREELIEHGYIEVDEDSGEGVELKAYPTSEEWAKVLGLNTSYELPAEVDSQNPDKHSDTKIQTLLYPHELESRVSKLLRTANLAIQETGSNILYLALGFLEWHGHADSKKQFAPLFLIPVFLEKETLDKKTKLFEYSVNFSGDDIVPNYSLREKLRVDFNISLPDLDNQSTPEKYFKEVAQRIRSNPSWKIRRYASFALLNFSKMLMYLDLDLARWPEENKLLEHPLMLKFLSGFSEADDQEADPNYHFGEEHAIDDREDIHDTYPLIDDADSSQHSALIDAINGKDLVIEGPPGTGKSQTITNLIAALLAQGKSVLFVAEKLAALEVVKRRLDRADLGDFCLELHSHKSQKKKVLQSIQDRLENQGHYRRPKRLKATIDGYEVQKTALNQHAALINKKWKATEQTISEILTAAVRFRHQTSFDVSLLHRADLNGDNLTPEFLQRISDLLENYQSVHRSVIDRLPSDVDTMELHPWFGLRNDSIQPVDRDKIVSTLECWQRSLNQLQESAEDFADFLNINQAPTLSCIHNLRDISGQVAALPKVHGNETFSSLGKLKGPNLRKEKDHLARYLELKDLATELAIKSDREVLTDLSNLNRWSSSVEQIEEAIAEDVSLEAFESALGALQAAKTALDDLEEGRTLFESKLETTAPDALGQTLTGFENFQLLIESVSALDPSLTRLRDPRFDNEELDELLPTLEAALANLQSQRSSLEEIFEFSLVPEYSVVREHYAILRNSGVFRVFSSDWRNARASVKRYLKDPKKNISKANTVLQKLTKFLEERDAFNGDEGYELALGEHFSGLDTNIQQCVALRTWYRNVRANFGFGIGPQVALGTSIFAMPDELIRVGRELSQQNAVQKISAAMSEIAGLGKIFGALSSQVERAAMPMIGAGSLQDLIDRSRSNLAELRPIIRADLNQISSYKSLLAGLKRYQALAEEWNRADIDGDIFGESLRLNLNSFESDTDALETLTRTLELAEAIEVMDSKDVASAIYQAAGAGTAFFERLSEAVEKLIERVNQATEHGDLFCELVDLDPGAWCGGAIEEQPFDILMARNQEALADAEGVSTWLSYLRSRVELSDEGLEELAANVEKGVLTPDKIKDVYSAAIFDQLSREIFAEEQGLGKFSGPKQLALQERLADYDRELKVLQREVIAARAADVQIPVGHSGGRAADYTERSLLEREITKKKQHVAIRQLMNRAGNAISAIKPCYMMGPMSVAQYLKPGGKEFDVLIMDEASQIKPQEALGAIARAKQLIVVGDPNQLPPTSFFDRINEGEDEDKTGFEESESILDAALPIFPKRRLRWHYRSEHESLIAFSNHFFYNDDLVVFPSPNADSNEFGVRRTFVRDGVLINRRNLNEVRAVAEAVKEHFLKGKGESLGVVAMNSEQREHIDAAVSRLAKEDDQFRVALEKDDNNIEPFFVKNLENVQGDERDVIFISMTYGPQEEGGRVMQRFGPINSEVGWRRLNVLFTRSKKRMHVFTSMTKDDILVGPEAKRGVVALRDFLAFSETGILARSDLGTGRPPDSDFEIEVISLLTRRGYECVPQVGVSGYFIDIAVKDPGNPGRFLMGIECDGANYHSAKSARDRDRLRQEVLERLGWRIRRIWSTDWFNNPDAELQPILDELAKLAADPIRDIKIEPSYGETENLAPVEEGSLRADALVPLKEIIEKDIDIRDGLEWLAKEIERLQPKTLPGKRLLRPAMIEAIAKYQPLDKTEFLRVIPEYLREGTDPDEGHFLNNIFEVVNGSLAQEEASPELPEEEVDSNKADLVADSVDRLIPNDQEGQHVRSEPREERLTSSVLRDIKKRRRSQSGTEENFSQNQSLGNSMEQIAVKLELHRLREKIWRETATEPDKFGILKKNLIKEYLRRPIGSVDDWEVLVGKEADKIHQSHKAYIPEIINILSKLREH